MIITLSPQYMHYVSAESPPSPQFYCYFSPKVLKKLEKISSKPLKSPHFSISKKNILGYNNPFFHAPISSVSKSPIFACKSMFNEFVVAKGQNYSCFITTELNFAPFWSLDFLIFFYFLEKSGFLTFCLLTDRQINKIKFF